MELLGISLTTMTTMLKALIEKVDNVWGQMDNVSREGNSKKRIKKKR